MKYQQILLVLALAVNGSCVAPIDIERHIRIDENADKTEGSKEETEEDQYDINEKMINEGLSLDDTENNGKLMDGDIMFLPGQREKYFEPSKEENDYKNDDGDDPRQPQNNHQGGKYKEDINDEYFDQLDSEDEYDIANKRERERELLRELEDRENMDDNKEFKDGEIAENEVLKSALSRWPTPIPYVLSNTLLAGYKKAIVHAMNRLTNLTSSCISFTRAKTISRQHMYFFSGHGCWSYIGRLRSSIFIQQRISIGNRCNSNRIIMHEIMHALGFFHEHSRTDRDKYVTINWRNIYPRARTRRNFDKVNAALVTDFGVPYDYQSIMHYRKYAFSKNGLPTITSKDPSVKSFGNGRNGETTASDIQQIKKAYCKPKPAKAVVIRYRRRRRRRRRWWGKK